MGVSVYPHKVVCENLEQYTGAEISQFYKKVPFYWDRARDAIDFLENYFYDYICVNSDIWEGFEINYEELELETLEKIRSEIDEDNLENKEDYIANIDEIISFLNSDNPLKDEWVEYYIM